MAQRGIREFDGKKMLANHWAEYISKDFSFPGKVVLVDPETKLDELAKEHSWLGKEKLVVKPDQLFGKRGKHGLIAANVSFDEAKEWIAERMNKETTVGKVTDTLTHFIIESYVPHDKEFYVAIKSAREGDTIYFSNHGGVDIESVWDTVAEINVAITEDVDKIDIEGKLPKDTPKENKKMLADFIKGLFRFYRNLGYAYLEINPFVISGKDIVPLDLVARIDDTAVFEFMSGWGDLKFPPPFGRKVSEEEAYIKRLDNKSGASLKLTVLNPKGRIWTMVAGGGSSVIYADTIVDLGYRDELANYGEYSGNPSTDETYEYAKTVLDLMTREKDAKGRTKLLLIGGGIANFTDVAKTFKGIIMALREYKDKLKGVDARIYVRRGGPNYQEGLENMKKLGEELGLPIEVYGPETHMTRIVNMALEAS
ncbi:MAG: ATPase [Candidatus Altiarchaeota archaeon]|nr:ATPase [Candidatus Altiarchaeota archaeon]MBU4341551.1 ATPase [Candidatus Altiarchaeota archaeon]MBU4437014.1 ATPase [Candidatus Altiarchaeota archaeon]